MFSLFFSSLFLLIPVFELRVGFVPAMAEWQKAVAQPPRNRYAKTDSSI